MGFLGLIFFYIGISMGWLYVRFDFDISTLILMKTTDVYGCYSRQRSGAYCISDHLEKSE